MTSNWLTEGLSERKLKREEVKALKSSEKFLKKVELNKQKCYNIFNNSRVANCPKCGSTNLGILSYDENKLFSTNYAIFCKNDNCFCTGAIRRRMKDAIIAWNECIAQFVDRGDITIDR